MTVQTETSRSGPYAGAGTTGPFTVGFRFLANAHLRVIRTTSAGIDSTLTLNTDYTVTGAGGSTGAVTLTSALASGEKLTIVRDVPFTQNADYVPGDAFPAESHEDALDLLTMQTQQLAEAQGRALTLPVTVSGASTELPFPSGLKVFGWNAAGTAIENLDANTLASIIAYGTAASDLFDGDGVTTAFSLSGNPASINNLEVSIGGVAQRPGLDYLWASGTIVTFTTAPAVGTDNILVRYMQALAMGSSVAADVSYTPAGAGAAVTTVQAKLRESVSVKDFGASGDGVTDDTSAIQAAFNYCQANAKTALFPDGVYRASGLIAQCPISMSEFAKIKYNGLDNGTALTLSSSGLVFGLINVDGNEKNVTPVAVSGDENSILKIIVSSVIATSSGDLSFCGVRISGARNNIGVIEAHSLINISHPNGSFPQAVLASGAENKIGTIVIRDGRAGLVCSTDVLTSVGSITAYNMLDNGIYQLAGILSVGSLEYYGTEEPAVFLGSATIDSVVVKGPAGGIGFQNCGDVTVNSLHVDEDVSGATPSYLFRIRATSTNCGSIKFGRITGKIKGSTLFLTNVGSADFLSIGSLSVKFLYDDSVATALNSWANISSFKGFRLSDIYVEVIDIFDTITTQVFIFTVGTVVNHSFAHDIDVQIYDSDGVTESTGIFRGVNFAQQLIETRGIQWRTDIGPYVVGSTLSSGIDDTANAIPTTGGWKRGKRLLAAFPAPSGTEGWVCTTSGTPGVWKTFGTIAA